ncbi:MAG: hypothetical protein NC121_05975 [Blautia sp.]|nr:hypothetical protein [Blautia sp.]
MEEKKNKCPLCNKRLVMKDGVPTCPDCGYRDPYRSGGAQSQADQSQPPRMNYGQQSQTNSGWQQPQTNSGWQQPQTNNGWQPSRSDNGWQPSRSDTSHQQPGYGQQPKMGPYAAVVQPSGKEKKKGNVAAVVIIATMTVTAVVVLISVLGTRLYSAATRNGQEEEGSSHRDTASAISSFEEYSVPSSVQSSVSDVSHLTFHQPESKLLQEFVSQLFGKPASSVTREELNSVVGLKVRDMYNYSGVEVAYELSDGTVGTAYLTNTYVDSGDFKCFPGIQTLDLGRESLDWDTDWHNLTSLTSLSCDSSLEDLEEYMDVSQLTLLSLTCDFMMDDCSGLGAYSGLKYLKLDCGDHGMALDGVSQASSLETLIIEDGDFITDFGELYDMTQLKELSIESDGLRDIGFIREMPGLESLELVSTGLLQAAAIADRADTLKCLRLHQNYSLEDYSPVFECTGLEELELYVDYDFDQEMVMPDLSMMPGLKVLTLGNYERYPGLGNLTALESLTLAGVGSFGSDGDLESLENLTSLKTLSFIDMSMESRLLESFASVPSLETLDLTDSFIWGDLNAAFGLPNLKTLILEDADFGLRLEGMPVSESLQELDMRDANVHQLKEDGSWDYGAGSTRIMLGGYTEFFEHMPNLAVLKAPGQELQDVEFAGNLTQLTYLDITDNYVTDLSPLAGLEQFKVLVCANNPIRDMAALKNVIIIK